MDVRTELIKLLRADWYLLNQKKPDEQAINVANNLFVTPLFCYFILNHKNDLKLITSGIYYGKEEVVVNGRHCYPTHKNMIYSLSGHIQACNSTYAAYIVKPWFMLPIIYKGVSFRVGENKGNEIGYRDYRL